MAQHIDVSGLTWATAQAWGGKNLATRNFGTGKLAFVIDSGVALSDDLNVNTELSRNFMRYDADPHSDVHNHGTPVAKLIGAKVDAGVNYGVAPGAEIVSLKVFDKDENGIKRVGDIAGAMEYAARYIVDNNLQETSVINMSLGGRGVSARQGRLHDIAIRYANLGVRFSISAGNHNGSADSNQPGNAGWHPNVYTAAAHNQNGSSTWFTGYGDTVDFSAPGGRVPVNIDQGNGLVQTIFHNGTSFSAPILGALVLTGGLTTNGKTTSTNPDKIHDKAVMSSSHPAQRNSFKLKQDGSTFIGSNYQDSIIAGGFGAPTIDIDTRGGDDYVRLRRGTVNVELGGGDDIIIGSKRRRSTATIVGGDGADTFTFHRRGTMVIGDYSVIEGDTILTNMSERQLDRLEYSYEEGITTLATRRGRTILGGLRRPVRYLKICYRGVALTGDTLYNM